MQNRSFDHLFGTFPGVNGIQPAVPGYSQVDAGGKTVTPMLLTDTAPPDLSHSRSTFLRVWDQGKMDKYAYYNGDIAMGHYDNTTPGMAVLWNWASQFALADNFFASVMSDAPTNQLYLVAATDGDNPSELQPFYPPCNTEVSARHPYTFPHVGDQMDSAGLTWAWYQENLNQCGHMYIPQENPFQFFADAHSSSHVRDLSQFDEDLGAGKLPALVLMQPSPMHDMHPAAGVPVSAATAWLDGLIKEVQASSVWSSAAIIVIWDSSGGWWDHVPPPQVESQGYGARVPMIAISPFAKRGYVSHVQMDDVSILQFIQETFGLPPLNARNRLSNDLSDMFTF
jgi:phospholipase C